MNEILSMERRQQLGSKPRESLIAVMPTKPQETRHLVQARNPPVSDTAAQALEALRANGESIPLDLSPQPIDDNSIIVGFDEL